ncbi:MAG: zinc ribbon domain-containing protein [Acidobacteriaceae bacterium]|nr:zinc ribbon domain-containing protein [Acidobacteriaceae bacterium]MBV9780528.1 zinc ribbon domain-containing protein [Acidobacteriaceae bacterium]
MPIFEYSCDDCGTKFERLVRRSDQDRVRCPACGDEHVTTQYSTFAAKTGVAKKDSEPGFGCGGGMCQNGMCGMNVN